MKKIFFEIVSVAVLLLSAVNPIMAEKSDNPQLAASTFLKTIRGPYTGAGLYNSGRAAYQTSDLGYILAGNTTSFGAGKYDFLLLKFDYKGNFQWGKSYGSYEFEFCQSFILTNDGGYMMAGDTYGFDSSNDVGDDILLIKVDNDGNLQWAETIGNYGYYDQVHCIQQTSDGGYILTGQTRDYYDNNDLLILKLNSQGDFEWAYTTGDPGYDDYGIYVQQTSDQGYIVTGYNIGNLVDRDILLAKFDSVGNREWVKFGGRPSPYKDVGLYVSEAANGYMVAGNVDRDDYCDYDIFVANFDYQGNLQGVKAIGGYRLEYFASVGKTSDNGYVVIGMSDSFGPFTPADQNIFLAKFDQENNLKIAKILGQIGGESPRGDGGSAVSQTSDDGFLVTGTTSAFDAALDASDILFAKFDSQGNIGEKCPYLQTITHQVDIFPLEFPLWRDFEQKVIPRDLEVVDVTPEVHDVTPKIYHYWPLKRALPSGVNN